MRSAKWPSADYMLNRWPSSNAHFEARLAPPAGRKAFAQALKWAGMPTSKRSMKAFGLKQSALHSLVNIAARNLHSNKYHDPQHSLAVIYAAGFIGAASGLPKWYRAVLVLAALVHDLDHQGRFMRSGYAAQEIQSFEIAKRVLSRHGVHPQIVRHLEELLLATYPSASEASEIRSGPVGHMIECLVDADLFQSLFTRHRVVDRLTAKLKHEMRLPVPRKTLQQEFVAARRRIGLQSAGGRWLHGELPDGYTYFNTRTGWF